MKALRFCGIMALVMALLVGLSFPAAAAKLPVPVNLFGMATDGAIDIEGYTQILPNGTVVNPFVLPPGKTLIVNYIYVRYIPTSSGSFAFAIISPGTSPNHFYRWGLDSNGGLIQTITPGLALSILPVMRVEDSAGNPITSGTLKVRFFGIVQ